jgi:hypothetical protein
MSIPLIRVVVVTPTNHSTELNEILIAFCISSRELIHFCFGLHVFHEPPLFESGTYSSRPCLKRRRTSNLTLSSKFTTTT